jgi:dolichol-phosphate mannosyltransferase
MQKLSIVVPIFNEEENINILHSGLTHVAQKLKHFDDYEIIAVNDGSRDRSLEKLKSIAQEDYHLKIISFTRNFGQEPATVAGVTHATGDAVSILDADLQDPPELLLEFEKVLHDGYDIAYGQRPKRLEETFFKKLTSKIFYRVFRWFTKLDVPKDIGNCCMLSRRATESFKNLSEQSPFIRAMIFWSGLPKKAVIFIRQKRAAGKTKYNYWKLTRYAIDNIILFSTIPLYFLVFFSGGISALSILASLIALVLGKFSIMFVVIVLLSVLLCSISLIGLYVGKIFEEIKNRPLYVIGEVTHVWNRGLQKHFEHKQADR